MQKEASEDPEAELHRHRDHHHRDHLLRVPELESLMTTVNRMEHQLGALETNLVVLPNARAAALDRTTGNENGTIKAPAAPSLGSSLETLEARTDGPLDARLDRVDGSERLAAQLGQMQHQLDTLETKLDAKLDAAVYQILAKIDQRIDPMRRYTASPSGAQQASCAPDTGERRRFELKLQPMD